MSSGREPVTLTQQLHAIFDTVTPPNILDIDKKYNGLSEANGKILIAALENPVGLELQQEWASYRLIKSDLTFLAEQRLKLEKNLQNHVNVIVEAANGGMTITDSITILKKIKLQVIGTEHPTDALSPAMRNLRCKLAKELRSFQALDIDAITVILEDMRTADPIPKSRRKIVEEVNRDITFTLAALYDSMQHFVEKVLQAYQVAYGAELFNQYEDYIWSALETLIRDGQWPGGDADNNPNATPTEQLSATRIRRREVADKHSKSLEADVIELAKELELNLRKEISELNLRHFERAMGISPDVTTALVFHQFQNKASDYLIKRKFSSLLIHYENMPELAGQENAEANAEIKMKYLDLAKRLVQLTRLSGSFRPFKSSKNKLEVGALQKLKNIFANYKQANSIQSDAISIEGRNATEFVIEHFENILKEHHEILNKLPELKIAMRYFRLKLHAYGMSYGEAHVRQDSSIYLEVWDTILTDLKNDPAYASLAIFQNNKSFLQMDANERFVLLKQIQDPTNPAHVLLEAIYSRKNHRIYVKKSKKDPKFANVLRELDRIEIALHHPDMYRNLIISNATSAADVFGPELLIKALLLAPELSKGVLSQPVQQLQVVPLLETCQDLANYSEILQEFIKLKKAEWLAQNPDPDAEFEFELMVGYSDSERVSGLAALLRLQKTQELIVLLGQKLGTRIKFFHGAGGDLLRSGPDYEMAKMTVQGNMRNRRFDTLEEAVYFRECQLRVAFLAEAQGIFEYEYLPPEVRSDLTLFYIGASGRYEYLHEIETGFGIQVGLMFGLGAKWLVDIINSSSRPAARRGDEEDEDEGYSDRSSAVQEGGIPPAAYVKIDKLRAITMTQANEMLSVNFHVVGPGWAMRQLGVDSVVALYSNSKNFREIYDKTCFGLAKTNLDLAADAYFAEHPELRPASPEERQAWLLECESKHEGLFTEDKVKEKMKTAAGKAELMHALSRFFVLIEEEFKQTCEFMYEVNKALHPDIHYAPTLLQPTDLLSHDPAWQQQIITVNEENKPLSMMLTRVCQHVANGERLNIVYQVPANRIAPGSELSQVSLLIGKLGASTRLRDEVIMPVDSTKPTYSKERALRHGHLFKAKDSIPKIDEVIQNGHTQSLVN